MSFVVDQQQYLQGYLPVVMLYLYAKHEGNTVGAGTSVPTGPLLVDKTNVAKVAGRDRGRRRLIRRRSRR